MDRRLKLQLLLASLPGVAKAYFQPPADIRMDYPCIVYQRDSLDTIFADNNPYRRTKRYQVTVIDQDPDSTIPDLVAALPFSTFSRHFNADKLNHDVYTLYF